MLDESTLRVPKLAIQCHWYKKSLKILHTGRKLFDSKDYGIDLKIIQFQEESEEEDEARFLIHETDIASVDGVIVEPDSERCELESNATLDLTGLDAEIDQ